MKTVMKAEQIVRELTKYSSHALLAAMIATFALAGIFQAQRLKEEGWILAGALAVTTQVIRLASGLTSAGFFRQSRKTAAAVVLLFSLSVTIFETYHESKPTVLLMIWSGFFLEIFLGMSVKKP